MFVPHIMPFHTVRAVPTLHSERHCTGESRTRRRCVGRGGAGLGGAAGSHPLRQSHVQTDGALEGPPEALQPESLGKPASLVLFPIHYWRDCLGVLHNDGHFTVTLSQHASVIYVGRACKEKLKLNNLLTRADSASCPPHSILPC